MFPGFYCQFLCCFGFPVLEFPRGCSWCHPAGGAARIPWQGDGGRCEEGSEERALYSLHFTQELSRACLQLLILCEKV